LHESHEGLGRIEKTPLPQWGSQITLLALHTLTKVIPSLILCVFAIVKTNQKCSLGVI